MGVEVAVLGAGALMQGFGNYNANLSQAGLEERNARSFEEQARYVASVGRRKLELLTKDQRSFLGRQQSALIANGIGFSGSALDVVVGTEQEQRMEQRALVTETEQEVRSLLSGAGNARSRSDALKDPWNNFLQAGGSVLTGASHLIGK